MDETASAAEGPVATADTPAEKKSRKAFVIIAVVIAVLVVAGGVTGVVLSKRNTTATYTVDTESRFLESCTASGGDPVRNTCQCLYDEIVATVPFDRFEQINQDLLDQQAAGQPIQLPDDIDAMRVACVAKTTPTAS